MRTRILLLAVLGALLTGCAWFRDPPEQGITTGATVVYSGRGFDVFSICDKTDKVFMTQKNPQLFVVKDGCAPGGPGGVGGPGSPPPLAVAATEKVPPLIPQPFLVQLVPAPGAPPAGTTLPTEPRDPIILRIEPTALACPACPVAPPILQPQSAPLILPPQATPLPARKSAAPKAAVVVAGIDPNTASAEDLERLPGVTAKMAQSIIRGRPYRTGHELVEKKVLSETDLAAVAPYLVIR
jgi:competence protein ComEA